MKNIEYRITAFGDASVIKQMQSTLAPPQEDEIQMRILASGLSMADILIRRGVYVDIKKPDVIGGYEAVGVITALGSRVSKTRPELAVDKQVAVMTLVGNHTHYRNINISQVVKFPTQLPEDKMPQASALMLNYVTAYQMINRQGLNLEASHKPKRVLIHSAAGGVGLALIQLLKPFEVELWGTASQRNHQRLKSYGVTPIDYRTDDVVAQCKAADGMDIVFDGIGGQHLNLSQKCLSKNGQLVFFGMTDLINGTQPTRLQFFNYMRTTAWYFLLAKIIKKYRFYSITDMRKIHPDWFVEDFEKVFELFIKGDIEPELAPVLPMSKIEDAHTLLEQSKLQGKQVLIPDPLFN